MKTIPLHGKHGTGTFAIVDEADYERLARRRWHTSAGYVRTGVGVQVVYMHRLLLGLGYGNRLQGDHINGNTLDNRRCNLRICTSRENIGHARERNAPAS